MFKTLFAEAIFAITANKSRTLLTLLGIVIGIASVITVLAAGEGGKSIIMKEFEGLSPTTLQIMPNWQDWSYNRAFDIEGMTDRDLKDLENLGKHIRSIAPISNMSSIIKVGDVEKRLSVTGTNSNYIDFVEFELESGRIIMDEEVTGQSKVAIIGQIIKEEFFPDSDPVGQYMSVFGTPVKIIGVLKRKEKADTISISNPDDGYNNAIVVPISLFERLFANEGDFYTVLCRANSIEEIPKAKKEILNILARNHGKWDDRINKFMIFGMKEQLDMINTVVGTVTIGVAVLAGIALLVAAIGIMNIMLVSVKERTREIGLRKAIGAKEWHIRSQFLIETLILCGGGGLLGLGLSFAASYLIGYFAKWPVIINPATAAFSVLLSLLTGLLSGFYPATRAAALIPHEALRYE
ncbi:ABC transporter permease [Spirochaeta isovalerica]|uniref:Putative ABC transport system permease protein n=1 Tax=Spirochaeta isovalerica TaxID=150 RepID=A0A841RF64_9SPIO|nr:ABC transporter permease [Spirochaeta isovalerica]MBB6481002.1 putative ABC transport system permease protein [Spirochaeta isovalerica]